MILAVAFLFGITIGSFLNVCIARLPQERSVVMPPSACPRCQTRISWYDNIPILSFLVLRARCRACGQPISWRYPAVELLNGLAFAASFAAFGVTGEALLTAALCSSLLVITFIDLDHQIIPDVITLPGIVVGLLLGPFFMGNLAAPLPFGLGRLLPPLGPVPTAFGNSLIGILLGGGPLYAIGWTWKKLRNVEAMGGGDIKLMGMVGALLGWRAAVTAIMLGAVAGSVVGIALVLAKRTERDQTIPFGPFLATGTVAAAFYGNELWEWYFGLLNP